MTRNEIMALPQGARVAYVGGGMSLLGDKLTTSAWSGVVLFGRPNFRPRVKRTADGLTWNMTDRPEDWERIDERI